jgi:small-conductance mechanosensitive channel
MDARSFRLLSVVLVLALAAVLHVAIRSWMRRQQAAEERRHDPRISPAGRRPWVRHTFGALAPPAFALLWLQGGFLGLQILLPTAMGSEHVGALLTAAAWLMRLAVLGLILWALVRFGRLVETFVTWHASRTRSTWDDVLLPMGGKAARLILPLIGLVLGTPTLAGTPALEAIVRDGTSLLLIGVAGYLLLDFVNASAALLLRQHRVDVDDNLRARSVHTQIVILKKVAGVVIAVFSVASMLMVFDSVRQFGASILASAGLAGLVIGFAAQRSIATLIAGFQLAVTQPIRVDDVVVVEGEWGRVEDITLTYVVVRIWDLRRLVLPVSYFIERPFQNWTRSSSDVLAAVAIYTDYTVPLEGLRECLTAILRQSPHWDGKVNVLQVTDAREHVVEIRALASAADASLAWDLRCEIREKLLGFLQEHHPAALPRLRVDLAQASARVGA